MLAQPFPYTLLSLPRYAKILGLNPVHFAGAMGQVVWPLMANRCEDIWVRQSWQYSDSVSMNDVALAIAQAEQDIANVLNYWPAPVWVENEPHRLASHYSNNHPIAQNNRGRGDGIQARWGKFINAGRRAVSLIGTAAVDDLTLVYSDEDGDGFNETATITLPSEDDQICGVKVYVPDTDGAIEWEIRSPRNKYFSGGNVVIVLDSWLLLDPDKQETAPNTEGFFAVDADDPDSYLQSVDVYYEYVDSSYSAQLFWEPRDTCGTCSTCAMAMESGEYMLYETNIEQSQSTCGNCGLTRLETCLFVRDVHANVIAVPPAFYNGRKADQARIFYVAGDAQPSWQAGRSCEPLSDQWALTIAMLATARLERDMCGCANSATLAKNWREDLSFTTKDGSHFVDFATLANPFGTRRGEIGAWMRVSKLVQKVYTGAVL